MVEVIRWAVELSLRLTPDRFDRARRAVGRFAGDAAGVSVHHDGSREDADRARCANVETAGRWAPPVVRRVVEKGAS